MIGWETCVSALTSSKTKYTTNKVPRLLSTIMLFHGTVALHTVLKRSGVQCKRDVKCEYAPL